MLKALGKQQILREFSLYFQYFSLFSCSEAVSLIRHEFFVFFVTVTLLPDNYVNECGLLRV